MSDVFRLIGTLRPAADAERRPPARAEGASGRAFDDPRRSLDAALDRLDRQLRSGAAPDPLARRGTYLNILV